MSTGQPHRPRRSYISVGAVTTEYNMKCRRCVILKYKKPCCPCTAFWCMCVSVPVSDQVPLGISDSTFDGTSAVCVELLTLASEE